MATRFRSGQYPRLATNFSHCILYRLSEAHLSTLPPMLSVLVKLDGKVSIVTSNLEELVVELTVVS